MKVIVVGIADKYLQNVIQYIEQSDHCDSLKKIYTGFQFFNEYKAGDADIIFIDKSVPDKDPLSIAEQIRNIDGKPILVCVCSENNAKLAEDFKAKIKRSTSLIKTKATKDDVETILEKNITGKKQSEQEDNKIYSGKTVLVVDDFENTLNVIQHSLEFVGFNVVTASNGREALKMLDSKLKPNVIISDLNMPHMDGFTFIEKVKSFEWLKDVPIFVLTTEFSITKKIKAKELKITGWIQKPYDINEFIAIVKNAVR